MKYKNVLGFLLIELGIAISILAVGMLALVGTMVMSVESVDRGKDTFYMTEIGKQKLDWARWKGSNYYIETSEQGFVSLTTVYSGNTVTSRYRFQFLQIFYNKTGGTVSVSGNPVPASVTKKVVVVTVTCEPESQNIRFNRTQDQYKYVKMETTIARQQ